MEHRRLFKEVDGEERELPRLALKYDAIFLIGSRGGGGSSEDGLRGDAAGAHKVDGGPGDRAHLPQRLDRPRRGAPPDDRRPPARDPRGPAVRDALHALGARVADLQRGGHTRRPHPRGSDLAGRARRRQRERALRRARGPAGLGHPLREPGPVREQLGRGRRRRGLGGPPRDPGVRRRLRLLGERREQRRRRRGLRRPGRVRRRHLPPQHGLRRRRRRLRRGRQRDDQRRRLDVRGQRRGRAPASDGRFERDATSVCTKVDPVACW